MAAAAAAAAPTPPPPPKIPPNAMEKEVESRGLAEDDPVSEYTGDRVDEKAGETVGSEVIDGEDVDEGELIERAEAKGVRVNEEDEVGDRDLLEDMLIETEGLKVATGASVREMTDVTEVDIDIVQDMSDGGADGETKTEGNVVSVEVGVGV